MQYVTKEEMLEVRKEAMEQMSMNKTANLIKEQLKAAHDEVGDNEYEFQVSDDPWSEVHRKLDSLGQI